MLLMFQCYMQMEIEMYKSNTILVLLTSKKYVVGIRV